MARTVQSDISARAETSIRTVPVVPTCEIGAFVYDIEISLDNRPGSLASLGETLGAAGVSVEGGGMWVVGGTGVAHFLVADGPTACDALEAAGFDVAGCREVLVQRLAQDVPGQLGAFCRAMADAGVNIDVLYSDHDHQLVVAVDDHEAGGRVSAAWNAAREGRAGSI